jgi:hypothetical protein
VVSWLFTQETGVSHVKVDGLLMEEHTARLLLGERVCFADQDRCPAQIIPAPDVRQRDHFSCGAAATLSVTWLHNTGFVPKSNSDKDVDDALEATKKALGTDVEESTKPQAIIEFLSFQGLQVESRSGMTLALLQAYTARGWPVIVCCQDYGVFLPPRARYQYGHYLTVLYVGMGVVIYQDSSADNVVAGGDKKKLAAVGSIQKPGWVVIDQGVFDRMWHDKDIAGKKYDHFGIAVGPVLPAAGGTVAMSKQVYVDGLLMDVSTARGLIGDLVAFAEHGIEMSLPKE